MNKFTFCSFKILEWTLLNQTWPAGIKLTFILSEMEDVLDLLGSKVFSRRKLESSKLDPTPESEQEMHRDRLLEEDVLTDLVWFIEVIFLKEFEERVGITFWNKYADYILRRLHFRIKISMKFVWTLSSDCTWLERRCRHWADCCRESRLPWAQKSEEETGS